MNVDFVTRFTLYIYVAWCPSRSHILVWKGKGKDHPRAGHEGPEGE